MLQILFYSFDAVNTISGIQAKLQIVSVTGYF